MNTVQAWNNEAVHALRQGHVAQAMDGFIRAVQGIRNMPLGRSSSSVKDFYCPDDDSCVQLLPAIPAVLHHSSSSLPMIQVAVVVTDTDDFGPERMAGFVLYNLGLTIHMNPHQQDGQAMSKARRMYEMAIKCLFLDHHKNKNTNTARPLADAVVGCAAMHNAAVLAYQMKDYVAAHDRFAHLLEVTEDLLLVTASCRVLPLSYGRLLQEMHTHAVLAGMQLLGSQSTAVAA